MASGEHRLLVERAGSLFGFDGMAAALGRPALAPYLFVVAVWVYDVGLLSAISYLRVGRGQFETPYLVTIPLGLVIAVRLARWLRTRYDAAVMDLPGDELDVEALRAVPTGRTRLAMLGLIYVGNLVQLALSPAEVAAFVDLHGPLVAYTKYLTASVLYFTVFADVIALVGAALFVLPVRMFRSKLTLDFSDLDGFAGLRETSRLFLAATVTYYAGLTAWSVVLVTPTITGSSSDVSTADTVLFTVLWVGGFLLYLAPVLLLHVHMSREKERMIHDIDADIRDLDPEGERKGVPYLTPEREDVPTLQQKYIELQQVRETREYPADVTIAGELLAATLVPALFQWGVATAPLG